MEDTNKDTLISEEDIVDVVNTAIENDNLVEEASKDNREGVVIENSATDDSSDNTDSNVETVAKSVEVLNFTENEVDTSAKNVNQNSYNDNSIRSLKASERVRRRPGVMFGTDDINGAFHTLKEVVGNSLDEARAGYGKDIYVTLHKDKAFTVRDNGRGVPMGWNEDEGRYNWDLIFNECATCC